MKNKGKAYIGMCLIIAFALWTVLVCLVDVRPIGPEGSDVGFAAFNKFVHGITGENMLLYAVTDWLGIIPIGVALGFAVFGLAQWIKRKSFFRVDLSILILGVFYIAVIVCYVLFELVPVNYRPVLIDGCLETSYPSSTTMLVMCVMPTAAMQFNARIKNAFFRRGTVVLTVAFTAFMVIGRFLSGVHWVSDIVGGALVSAGLVTMYSWANEKASKHEKAD